MKENQRKPLVPQCHKDWKLETLNWHHHHHLQQTTKTQLDFLSNYQKTTRQQKKMIKPHFPPTSHCLFGRQEMETKKKNNSSNETREEKREWERVGFCCRKRKQNKKKRRTRTILSLPHLSLSNYLPLSLSLSLSLSLWGQGPYFETDSLSLSFYSSVHATRDPLVWVMWVPTKPHYSLPKHQLSLFTVLFGKTRIHLSVSKSHFFFREQVRKQIKEIF